MCSQRLQAAMGHRLVVGHHAIDLDTLRVASRGRTQKLTPKAVDVLLALADCNGRTMSHAELLESVWSGTCPTRNVLAQAIKELRRSLDDDGSHCIETIPKVGYRLIVPARFESNKARCRFDEPTHAWQGGWVARFRRALVAITRGYAGVLLGIFASCMAAGWVSSLP